MAKGDKVTTLIKNMSKSEKRYFKIFSDRHVINDNNKYVVLFDTIDNLKNEEIHILEEKLKKQKLNTDFLSADKNYLYQLILRALQSFHHNKTQTIYQVEQLLIIEILYEKGLYQICLNEIEKTIKIAEKVENFSLIVELLTWKRRCKGYSEGFMSAYDTNAQIKQYHTLMANQIEYTDLYYDALKIRNKVQKARKETQIKEFKQFLKNPLLEKEDMAKSLLAKIRFHLVYVNYYYSLNDNIKEAFHLKTILKLMEESEYYHLENPFDYIYTYNQYLNLLSDLPEKEFQKDLEKFKAFPEKIKIAQEKSELQVFYFSSICELQRAINKKDTLIITQNIPGLLTKLEKYSDRIEPAIQLNIYYLSALAYFYNGNYKQANKLTQFILDNFSEEDRADLYNFCRLFELILFIEQGKLDLLPYTLQSSIKYFKKHDTLYPTELMVIDFINALIKSDNPKKDRIYLSLVDSLRKIKKINLEQSAQNLFDYEFWALTKV
jgi:hypothetical protein